MVPPAALRRPLALLLLLSSGCASTPVPEARTWPGPVAAAWPAADALAAPAASNPNVEAPRPAVAPTRITPPATWHLADAELDRLLQLAQQANPTIDAARGVLDQARALRMLAAASLWPSVEAAAAAQASRSGDLPTQRSESVSLATAWAPDVFGAGRAGLSVGEANARAAAADLAEVQDAIATEVAQTYLALRSARQRLAIAQAQHDSLREILQITRWRVQAGLLNGSEALQALTAAEQASATLPGWQMLAAQATQALAVLTGQAPGALQPLLQDEGGLPGAPADPALGTPAELVLHRPDLQAARHRVDAAQSALDQAEAARLPQVTLSGSLGLSALTLSSLASASSLLRLLAGRVAVPLFDGGAAQAQVAVQQAVLAQSLAAWRSRLGAAQQAVADALADLRSHRAQLTHLQTAALSATQAADLARQRFAAGLTDHATVLETERTRLATRDGTAAVQAQVLADQVRLAAALGHRWRGQAPPPTAPPRIQARPVSPTDATQRPRSST
jgi:outer membrane protein, multidrug efflux system